MRPLIAFRATTRDAHGNDSIPDRAGWAGESEGGAEPHFPVATIGEDLDPCTPAHLPVTRSSITRSREVPSFCDEAPDSSNGPGIQWTAVDQDSRIADFLRSLVAEAKRNGVSIELVAFSESAIRNQRDEQCDDATAYASSATGLSLKPRAWSILELIGHGYSNKQIARQLSITAETVKYHVKHIFRKLQVESRAEAVAQAYSLGLLKGPPLSGTRYKKFWLAE